MSRTYECMFLIDNDAVRAGWGDCKSAVSDLISKHGGQVLTSRRWDERRLAYPIRHKNRATYLLNYCDLDATQIEDLRRELDISEIVMRYLLLARESVPAAEHELSQAEQADGFQIPDPPPDDMPEPAPEPEGREAPKPEGGGEAAAVKKDEAASAAESTTDEAPTAGGETNATEEPVTAEKAGEEG